ncbi:acyl-CoA dehydrogenase family protein [Erythrobacter sp. WG]|uniref:acyl-CoA dehydrogenase family protein n=1 Tax=Erythrobacter sp. WG TaxID=2985510 RepID=UPI00226E1597|nr:acyl-CoA dehydrogenase family protein [Erythrobacter sp. WG]MCX9148500.1 acyl-CoA/acyl-ACP dehydrogenase [Erythrobacter sp. WG]
MIGFTPTAEQQQLVETARGFARKQIRPLAQRVRQEGAPDDPWPLVRPVFEAGAELGFTRLFVPEAMGGMGGTCLDAVLLLEELGAADVGIASDYFALTACMPLMAMRAGSPSGEAFVKRFAETPAMVLAGAQSEPDVAGSELMMAGPDPAFGPKLSAREAGDGGWVLSGRKSAFITNAGAADAYFIIARTDPAQPVFSGLSIFLVPAGTPGLTVGKKTKLIGWPLTTHAELVLDEVRLPPEALIGRRGGAAMTFGMVPEMPIGLAACFVGLARAAFEHARDYAAERKSTGRPIAQHQAVALKLAEMAINVETARLHVWQAAAACETDPMRAAMLLAPMAKATAVDMAIRNAELAVQVLGGYGVTAEYDAGHLLKDAWIGWSCDFTRDVLHLGIAQALTGDG